MRVAAKTRYGLAALMFIGQHASSEKPVQVSAIAETLSISKIFLEQAISALRSNGILISTKGKNGGYRLARAANQISALQVFEALGDTALENTETTVSISKPYAETSLNQLLWQPLSESIRHQLAHVSIQSLLDKEDQANISQSFMLNI